MITIHEAKAADFATLGMGALLPSECTIRERAGGMYELKIVHPITDDGRHHRIKPMRIIKAPAPVRETPLVEIGQTGTIYRDIYKVVTDGRRLYLRVKPDQKSKGLHAYKPGTEVAALDLSSDSKWRRVAILDGGATGWMWAGNLEFVRTETETIVGDTPGTVVQPRQTREQLFRVYFYSPDTKTRTITAEARHITYDLAGAVVDGEYSPENVPANQVCAQIMARADHDVSDFHIYCTIADPISGEYGGRNILDCLLDPETGIVAQTKARIVRDNYDIFILPDEVRSRGVELRYGKNLLSAYMDTDTSNTITRIKPVGKNKDGEPLYIEDNGGWVESPYINYYPVVYSKEVEYDVVENDDLPINQARALLKEKAEADFAAGCDMAAVKLDADFVRLELTEEYKHLANQYALHLYDSVPVIDREADIVATARMTEYVYDAILDEYQDTGLGELEEVKSTIYGYELAAGTVSGGKLIPNTVNGDRLQNSSVSYGKFDLAAIKHLSADAITAIRANVRELVAGNITTDQLYADLATIAAAQITAANIEKANIQWAQIENLSAEIAKVVNAEIENLEVDWAGIYEADIEWANITNLTAEIAKITAATIEKAKINWAQIVDVKIGTADIDNATITTAKIALGAITSALIKAGAIGTAQIADGSITEAKIVSLNADVIKTGTLSADRLLLKGEGGLFYEINATTDGLTSTQLTEEQYKNAISGTALVAKSVTAAQIAAKTITANEILANTITAAEINVANLFAADATIAELNNYILRTQTIEAIEGKLDVWADEKIRLGVKIGGTNLLRATGVTVNNGGACIEQAKTYYCRSGKAIRFNPLPASGQTNISQLQAVNLNKGKHTISFNAWGEGTDETGEIVVRFNLFDGKSGYDEIKFSATLDEKYQRFEGTFELGGNLFAYPRFLIGTASAFTKGNVYITDWKLEAGDRATDWTPSPDDTGAAIAELSAEMVVQAGEITANTTKIETVNQAAGKAQTTANAAQNTANAAQNTANAAQNAANGAQGTANNAVTRVTTAEQRISAVEGAITTKVSKGDFDALGNLVSQQETKIKQTDEEVLILAGRTVGGTNLLRNTETLKKANYSFNNSSGASAGIGLGTVTDDEYGGFRIVCKNQNVRIGMGTFPVTPEQTYAMSVQYKINSGTAPIQFQYVFKNAEGTGLYYLDSVNHSKVGRRVEDGWTVMTSVFTVPDDEAVTKMTLMIRTGLDNTAYTCDYNIRRPKLEAGSMPTDWTPSPYDPSNGLDTGANSSVKVRITPDTFDVDVPGTDGDFTLNRTGARIPIVNADIVHAQNLAYRYNGSNTLYVNPNATSAQLAAGNYYRSLVDACAALSGRYLEKSVTITVQGATYGDAYLRGVTGYGSVTIAGGDNSLYGSLSLLDNTAEVLVNNLKIVRTGTSQVFAGRQYGMGWARWYKCVLDGNGGSQAMLADRGARFMIWDTDLYNAARLLQVGHNADASCISLRGGGGTHFFYGDGGRVTWSNTRPDGTLSVSNPCLMAPDNLAGIAIDYGTAQPSTPTISTASYNYQYSDSYAGAWGRPGTDAAQGVIRTDSSGTTAAIYGTIWFDAAAIRGALSGKTIRQVSLRLAMLKGYGRETTVSVQLYGTNTAYSGRSGQPALTTSYGTIGTTEPGQTAEITIPTAAISDIVNGTIQALVLKSDDSELYKDRDYSKNYARFAGSATADGDTCPRLTVVYQ